MQTVGINGEADGFPLAHVRNGQTVGARRRAVHAESEFAETRRGFYVAIQDRSHAKPQKLWNGSALIAGQKRERVSGQCQPVEGSWIIQIARDSGELRKYLKIGAQTCPAAAVLRLTLCQVIDALGPQAHARLQTREEVAMREWSQFRNRLLAAMGFAVTPGCEMDVPVMPTDSADKPDAVTTETVADAQVLDSSSEILDAVDAKVLDSASEILDAVDNDAPTCPSPGTVAKWRCYSANQVKFAAEHPNQGADTGPDKPDAYTGVLPPAGCPQPAVIESCCQDLLSPGIVSGDQCCYWDCTSCICGRPLVIAGTARSADSAERGDWLASEIPEAAPTDSAHAAALAAAWRADALDEHASVASFQRFGLELMACGAPPELIAAAAQAAIDEISHARLCFEIAHSLDGQVAGPGPLDCSGLEIRGDLAAAAVAAVREGCIGETLAAAQAGAAARRATVPQVAAALAKIAEDEARHAELAWKFAAWACATGGEIVRTAVAAAFADALAGQPMVGTREAELRDVPDEIRAAYGRLSAAEARSLARAVVAGVLAPCAERLVHA